MANRNGPCMRLWTLLETCLMLRFRVKWEGYDEADDDTWEPLWHLSHCPERVDESYARIQITPTCPSRIVI
ncbi:hypothetical protein POJ06DRAFT_244491 [Lipomyces tetrasporus]|uniref:Chromo domain-containing protein n=1 Tax=Lipomyces tetrasporus TaxID=54092 RepID=A0AAD7R0K0_9ASCO|nr:uncharacterized protein POJ06DRAFT_244491 [Lipomyces tetrasporus]KAJ8104421.1 hypothetical protein POJ06DRAFT_244491 [Lipomyces tetrasporus]